MKQTFLISLLSFWAIIVNAQYVTLYYNTEHFAAVSTNHTLRMSAEGILSGQTAQIRENTDTINSNMAKLVAAKYVVHNSLVNVNQILKDGKEVKYISEIVVDIISLIEDITGIIKDNPQLSLLSAKAVSDIKIQALGLYTEITEFINKEGIDTMMDYNKRDELLKDINQRLQIFRAVLSGFYTSLYWGKINGVWKSLSPFATWVNQDKRIIDEIMFNVKSL